MSGMAEENKTQYEYPLDVDKAMEGWIFVEATIAERVHVFASGAPWRCRFSAVQLWKLAALWGFVSLLLYAVTAHVGVFAANPEIVVALNLLWLLVLLGWHDRRMLRRLAQSIGPAWRFCLRDDGLEVDSVLSHTLWRWEAVSGLVRRSDSLLVFLGANQALMLPSRCFASPEVYSRWVECLQRLSGLEVRTVASVSWHFPAWRVFSILADFCCNVEAGLRFLLFLRSAAAHLRVGDAQIPLFAVSWLLVRFAADFFSLWLDQGMEAALGGDFFVYGIISGLALVLLVLICAWGVARRSARPNMLAAFLALAVSLWWIEIVQAGTFWWANATWYPTFVWLMWAWALCAAAVALMRVLQLALLQRVSALCCVALLYGAAHLLQADNFVLWTPAYDENAAAEAWTEQNVANESVLYSQPELLDDALGAIQPGRKGVPELYLLAYGGYGEQDVFLHEVESVDKLFAERFGTRGHSVVLVNSAQTLEKHPMATTIALREALVEIGKKMNRDEDVLFLFMTSHGARDHHFSLELGPYVFNELTPQILRGMLDESGIKNRVILVSACYSGGFIRDLSDRNTLVMSASREDRSSHGCQQGADWTFFGKAYFDEALRHTRSFEKAFDEARVIVAEREKQENVTPSEPQIAIGSAIRPVLAIWEKGLEPAHR
jgi:hypothetical protein